MTSKIYWVPIIYFVLFAVIFLIVLPVLDNNSVTAIASVLAGGLAGVIGSFIGAFVAVQRVEKESEVRLKENAAKHSLELTKLELEYRRAAGRETKILAAAKIYRELYKALFDLYETKNWPSEINELGLLNIYDFTPKDPEP